MSETAAIQALRTLFEEIRDERRTYANTATRIGNAFLSLLSYLTNDSPYLRKDSEDSTRYLLTLLAGCVIGESKNITLNADGSITCGSIRVDGSAIFNELVFNHQNVLEGDTYFTDRGIIETVEHVDVNQYRLTFRKMYDDDQLTFHKYDILRSSVNNLDKDHTYTTSWMRVDSVDTSTNSCVVTMYDGEDVPGGTNYAPSVSARVIRWGNQTDEDRQQVFFISSTDGRFLFLQGVDKPIVSDTNYSAFLGLPPDMDCLKDLPINSRQPYLYARGLIVQDLIKIDYKGQPEYSVRDWGTWDSTREYIHGAEYDDDENLVGYFTDRVWYGGCYWQCAVSKATVGKAPRYNNADWVCLIGNGDFSMEITSSAGNFFRVGAYFTTTLTATVMHGEMEIEEGEIGPDNITWTRISDDTDGDVAWNIKHAAGLCGLSIDINSQDDTPQTWGVGSTLAFQCEVVLDNETLVAIYSM